MNKKISNITNASNLFRMLDRGLWLVLPSLYLFMFAVLFLYFIILSGGLYTTLEIMYIAVLFVALAIFVMNGIKSEDLFIFGAIISVFGTMAYDLLKYTSIPIVWYFVIVSCISVVFIIFGYKLKGKIFNHISIIFLLNFFTMLFVAFGPYTTLIAEDIVISGFLIILSSIVIFVTLYSFELIHKLSRNITQYTLTVIAIILLISPIWPSLTLHHYIDGILTTFNYSYTKASSTSNITISTIGIIPSILPECLDEGTNGTVIVNLKSNYSKFSVFIFRNYSKLQTFMSNKWNYNDYQNFSRYDTPILLNSINGSFSSHINDTCIYAAIVTDSPVDIKVSSKQNYTKLITIYNNGYSIGTNFYVNNTNLPLSLYSLYTSSINYAKVSTHQ